MTMPSPISERFRGFLPVVIDLETGGFNATTDALLEIAAVFLYIDDKGDLRRGDTSRFHVMPFEHVQGKRLKISVLFDNAFREKFL